MSTASTIQQYYNAFYGRPADPSGLAFWVAGVNNSGDLIGAALKVFGSASTPEFALRYPAGTSTSTFLDTAYGNMFNRTPDADGKRFWETAFTNWVAGGKSEGEARALILQNFVESANAQVGTADKLTITNKLTVADMMTASVKAYGTEGVYLTKLDKAQKLLADVNAGQPSVDAALGKIKAGGIYEVGEPAPASPIYVDSFNIALGLTLSNDATEILRFKSASDAPFGYAKSGNLFYLKGLGVSKFDVHVDRIDLTAFNLNSADFMTAGPFPWSIDDTSSFGGTPPPAYKVHAGFFKKPVMLVAAGTGINESTEIFVDTNGNGALEPGIDLWVSLIGIWQGSVNATAFII